MAKQNEIAPFLDYQLVTEQFRYTYTIKASAEGVKVAKVQYYDGSRWVKGTSFKTHTQQDTLKIRITDSTGTVWSFTYQNGEVIAD